MNPVEQGKNLEEVITNAVDKLPGIEKNFRENMIRTYFNDTSLNGVDHWIQMGSSHILIQDKWKESTTQQEVSQFLTCSDRIISRLEENQNIYLIWACKKEPTSNSIKSLSERNVSIVSCSINIESLAKCVILQISECLSVDSTVALQSIQSNTPPTSVKINKNIIPPPQITKEILSYDETDDGKKEIEETKALIEIIQSTIFRKIEYALNIDSVPDTYNIWNGIKPKSSEDWWNGKVSKFDFSGFMKSMKTICWPTKQKKLQSRNLFFYTKLRKISVEFSSLASQYESKRKSMLTKKSIWAKQLTAIKANAEPISEAEFKGALENCEDYWMNQWTNGIGSEIKKMPNSGLMYAFHGHQCTVY